jgi:adenosylcobinamide-phosphate synthase
MLFDIAAPAVLAAALLLDGLIGDPRWLWSAVPHPVAVFGALIGWADRRLNRREAADRQRRGVLLLVVLVAAGAAVGAAGAWLTAATSWGWMVEAVVAFSLIAQRDLYDHVREVARALTVEGLPGGRRAVARIVGRDPDALDDHGVCRAAIESLAENFADGVVAPVFWYLVAGLPGLVVYKAVNTADSMIGHRTARHHAFGWAAARLDDLVNLPASRLSALLIVLAALGPGTDARGSLRAVLRDARRHRSPNAGWPEAAMAGALGLALAGPRVYGDTLVEDGFMGDGRREATAEDIDRALVLYRRALVLQVLLYAALLASVAAVPT